MTGIMGQTTSVASLEMTQNWKIWGVCCLWEGLGQARGMSQREFNEVQQRFRFCTWLRITPCTYIGWGLSVWRTAWKNMCGCWWTQGLPWASKILSCIRVLLKQGRSTDEPWIPGSLFWAPQYNRDMYCRGLNRGLWRWIKGFEPLL